MPEGGAGEAPVEQELVGALEEYVHEFTCHRGEEKIY